MTTTDKLTNAELFHYTHAGKPSERLMARELLAHRRASQAAPAPSDGLREVSVKPLEWDDSTRGMWSGRPSVKLGSLAFWVFLSDLGFEYISKGKKQSYPTLEHAKAAAQADYETLIRAALTPAPAQEGDE